ncbi:acetyl-CoA synthetase-like protein [Penicillium cosmopolitanum]|uniref:Acetyl-CoA synthetase-like protein n=1 Tax=Penicillium cosmopolitanum TaxID=1131564 RepID=A0A9W9VQF0_9EURO|nr:acetyl-CoA synthetase-like protein [Penicillium cosmopolitanum]KAJ5387407.1 acetyl-CoA synthetase-like protein [Penicillium cosmopolitanum]
MDAMAQDAGQAIGSSYNILFYLMGFISFVFSIFHGVPVVIFPDEPLSVEHLIELMQLLAQFTCPTGALYPPSVLAILR